MKTDSLLAAVARDESSNVLVVAHSQAYAQQLARRFWKQHGGTFRVSQSEVRRPGQRIRFVSAEHNLLSTSSLPAYVDEHATSTHPLEVAVLRNRRYE